MGDLSQFTFLSYHSQSLRTGSDNQQQQLPGMTRAINQFLTAWHAPICVILRSDMAYDLLMSCASPEGTGIAPTHRCCSRRTRTCRVYQDI